MSYTKGNNKKMAMLQALEKSLGVVTPACKAVDISRKTHYDWLKTDEKYKQQVADLENVALDFAESKLHQLVNGVQVQGQNGTYSKPPDTAATLFLLKCKGKQRGYVERQEITGANGGAIVVNAIPDNL